jgi:hypothetical protein
MTRILTEKQWAVGRARTCSPFHELARAEQMDLKSHEGHVSTLRTSYDAREILTISRNARSAEGMLRLPG